MTIDLFRTYSKTFGIHLAKLLRDTQSSSWKVGSDNFVVEFGHSQFWEALPKQPMHSTAVDGDRTDFEIFKDLC